MVAMEPKYLLRECLPSLSPQQTWGTHAVEQKPILLLLRKLIAFIPVNIEMVFLFSFFLSARFGVEEKCPFPAISQMSYGALSAAVAAGRNSGLGGGSWDDCCEQHPSPLFPHLEAEHPRVPALHPTGMWLAVLGERGFLAGSFARCLHPGKGADKL